MFPCYKDEGLNFRVTTLFAVKTTTQSYLCRLPHRNKFPVNGGKPVALTIPEEFSVLLAEDGFPMCIPPHTTRRLSEIQSRKIVFCSMHFSLLSATLAPWKEKVNILFRKILFYFYAVCLNIVGNVRNFVKKYIIQAVNRLFSAGNPFQLIETLCGLVAQKQGSERGNVHL